MKRLLLWLTFFAAVLPASAENRYILQAPSAEAPELAARYGLTLLHGDDLDGQHYSIVLVPADISSETLARLLAEPGVGGIDEDSPVALPEHRIPAAVPSPAALADALEQRSAVPYFGAIVRSAYVLQKAAELISLNKAHETYATGGGIVAIIDTGIDPQHPALSGSLVPGYDFTREMPGLPSEWLDLQTSAMASALTQSTVAILDQKNVPAILNQSTVAILDQSTVAILDGARMPTDFGHGTMVAGLVHLVAPTAQIMPLKVFQADGTSDLFQIIRAIYYAADHGAQVVNMSFSLPQPSPMLAAAIQYAQARGVICIASAGNDGLPVVDYPAGYPGVIGVGSTDNHDARSAFSNYGAGVATAAPGEALITAYPGNNYAGVWGTSFSAALVSGAAALMTQVRPAIGPSLASAAFDRGAPIQQQMGKARLDLALVLRYLSDRDHSTGMDLHNP